MVQIDMKMPNNCMVCPLLSYIPHKNGDDEPVCYYTGDDLPEGYFHYDGGRPEFCPLKEQEATMVIESENMYTGLPITHCPKCGKSLDRFLYGRQHEGKINFCPYCGQAVKWE